MPDIFISYAWQDRDWVETLAGRLAQARLSIWCDVRQSAGQQSTPEIERALDAADTIVVVWSASAGKSDWVRAELARAHQLGLVHFLRADHSPAPPEFWGTPTTDLSGWTGDQSEPFQAFVKSLQPAPELTAFDRTIAVAAIESRKPNIAEASLRTARRSESNDERTRYQSRALRGGDVIGHYRVVAPLGEGGTGAIYEARNIHNEDERVALKIILPDRADRDQFFGFLKAEANALQRIRHEAVVQYRTFGRIEGSDEFFLVIEYVEGPTLGAVFRRKPLNPNELRRLAIRLTEGLEAAHEQGVIHRDLSPDNIILPGGDPDRATLIDFGIARNGEFDPLGGSFAGKLSYAAPEQFDGDASEMGPWTDLYSLGLILAAASRGRRIDMGHDFPTAIAMRAAVPILADIHPTLQIPLSALLEPDPSRRVRSAIEAGNLFSDVATRATSEQQLGKSVTAPPKRPGVVVRTC